MAFLRFSLAVALVAFGFSLAAAADKKPAPPVYPTIPDTPAPAKPEASKTTTPAAPAVEATPAPEPPLGLEVVLSYPGHEDKKYGSIQKFLITKLKGE